MCGIAGLLNLDGAPAEARVVQKMVRSLAHRGPDGEGLILDGPLGLGHRRLAIVDRSAAGSQPMASPCGRWLLAYNGEVYNAPELRRELESLGATFRSHSDTEVVLAALVRWGKKALARFNGMFALALWDRRSRRLLLARDRYGIKPLYCAQAYCAQAGPAFVFGSETKALLAHPALRAEIDKQALVEYFSFQNIFGERTLLRGITTVPPASWVRVEPGRAPAEPRSYWDFDFREPARPRREDDYADELATLFAQAVGRQLAADVPLGAYLGGGIDSASIVALASRRLAGLPTFTCGFDMDAAAQGEQGCDERSAARAIADAFGARHRDRIVRPADLERTLPALVGHLEQPRVGQSYPNFCAAELASQTVRVVLAGTGGDELFGGYPWRYLVPQRAISAAEFVDGLAARWQRVVPAAFLPDVFRPIRRDVAGFDPRAAVEAVCRRDVGHAERLAPEDCLHHQMAFEARTFLRGLLAVEDKLSMAHGLETRVPFLDNDLVAFAMQLPAAMKVRQDDGGAPGKRILRKAARRWLPADVVERPKQGFTGPDASWFRRELRPFVERSLDASSPIYDWLQRPAVSVLLEEHFSGAVNRRLLIWSLLSFDRFCRTFLGGADAGALRPAA
jgi:asparagine synthase (glutamine-hydrolysing)